MSYLVSARYRVPAYSLCTAALSTLLVLAGCGNGDSPSPAAHNEHKMVAGAASSDSSSAVILRASVQRADNTAAEVLIRYNGETVTRLNISATETTDYPISMNRAVDGGSFEVVLLNAGGPEGFAQRSLTVESLTVGRTVLLPGSADVRFDRGDGVAAFDSQDLLPGRSTLASNGALRFKLRPEASLSIATQQGAPAGYYIDAELGNDSNVGSIDQPWRSLSAARKLVLPPGQGLYLRCGRVWRESLAMTGQQLNDGNTVASYGPDCATNKAVISGADDFSGGWALSGNVWSRSLPAGTPKITQLFINGQALHTAQWPNATASGRQSAFPENGASGKQYLVMRFTDEQALTPVEIAGATIQLRTQPWMVETRRIDATLGRSLRMERTLDWALDSSRGYVLQDKRWMLDVAGEFFHDLTAQRLYFIAPSTGMPADPNAARVEGSVRDVALALSQRDGLVIQNLELRMARQDGLQVVDATRAYLAGLHLHDNGAAGVRLYQWMPVDGSMPGPTVVDNLLSLNGEVGIDAAYVQRAVIARNNVLSTGNAAQHQASVLAAITAGPGARVENNRVDGSGGAGIRFSGLANSVVARNTVNSYCTRLSDCGAIYTWAGYGQRYATQASTVEHNRVLSAGSSDIHAVAGIYLDDHTRGVHVHHNMIAGAPTGIFVHNGSDMTIEDNRIWLSGLTGIWASLDDSDEDWLTRNVFRNNEIVPVVKAAASNGGLPSFQTSQAIWFQHARAGENALGAGLNLFSGNTVVQLQGPLDGQVLLRGPNYERFLDAAQWQAYNPGEPAVQRPVRFSPLTLALGPELVPDGQFDGGLGSWGSFRHPASNGFALSGVGSWPGCQGPCASFTAGHPTDLLGSRGFWLNATVPHVLRYRAIAPAGSAITVGEPYLSRDVTPWDGMPDYRGVTSYSPRRAAAGEVLDYEGFFIPKDSTNARLNLQLQTLGMAVGFDAVSVRAITGYTAAQVGDWTALALAPAENARVIGCAELGWPEGCSAMWLNGQPVNLPMTLPAGNEVLLLRADSPFRR
jgi:hypothetical protein